MRWGLIKAILELQHGVVPPMVHFNRLPDALAEIETGLFVPQESTPWPTDGHAGPRRAAVSSYGISGTNVHAIVEQAPETHIPRTHVPTAADDGPLLFLLSSTSADELRRTSRPAGRLAGSSARIRSRCRTWPTPWLAAAAHRHGAHFCDRRRRQGVVCRPAGRRRR